MKEFIRHNLHRTLSPMSAESIIESDYAFFGRIYFNGRHNLATALLLWDILVTLPKEKVYIWSYRSRATWTTLLYVITRYLPLTVNMVCLTLGLQSAGEQSSEFYRAAYIVPWFVALSCTEILFTKRVTALHGNSRLPLLILVGVMICELVTAFIVFFFASFFPKSYCNPGSGAGAVTHCMQQYKPLWDDFFSQQFGQTGLPGYKNYFTIPALIFQALLFMLIIKIVFSDWRGISKSNFISIVIRDGLWSYFCNLGGLLIIQPTWLRGPVGLPNMLWSYVSFSITSTRLILNLRAAAAKQSGLNDISTISAVGPSPVSTHLSFFQGVRSFFTLGNDEFSASYHYHDFGHDSDSEHDD